jgi:hypothetical protein
MGVQALPLWLLTATSIPPPETRSVFSFVHASVTQGENG